jgi:hypothetical protein
MDSVPIFVRVIVVLGPAFLGVILLFRFVPKLLTIMNRSENKRRPGEMADYAVDTAIALAMILLSLLAFLWLKPPFVATGSIEWGSLSGRLVSVDSRLFLSRTDSDIDSVEYDFQVVSKKKIEDGSEFSLVRESIASHGKGGAYELGDDFNPKVAGEDLVSGNEGLFIDNIKLIYSMECAGPYTYDFTQQVIQCPQESVKTGWLDWLVPSAYADVLDLIPSLIIGQSSHGKHQKLISTVTQWDVDVLTSERSSPGSKVAAMRNILTLNKGQVTELGELAVRQSNSTLPLDLLDLSRHTDPEVAAYARMLGDKMDVPRVLENVLAAWSVNPDRLLEKIVVLPPEYRKKILNAAADALKEPGFTKQSRRLIKEIKKTEKIPQQALIPTGTTAGDRYYISVSWDKSKAKTTSCLARAFEKSMNLWEYSHEKDFVAKNSDRTVYWYDRANVLNAAAAYRKCGAEVKYIRGFKASE